jgi:SPP1 gp7 family putative phage head morphogenesis protein
MATPPIYVIADRLAPALRKAFLAAIEEVRAHTTFAVLTAAIATGDITTILAAVQVARLSTALAAAVAVIETIVTEAAAHALTEVTELAVRASFTIVNPLAAEAARIQGARLVRVVTTETRQAIRALTVRAVTEGIAPRELAALIKPSIGLTVRQTQAVLNARAEWSASGLAGDALMKKVDAYEATLLKQRAVMIARTETIDAATAGQLAAWREAAHTGLLRPTETRRVWSAASDARVCPICAALDEQEVAFDDPFVTEDGTERMAPPIHPSCRCSVALRFVRARRAA